MTELYLNNIKAILPENFSCKLTSENPYFTTSGQYSYNIDLPAEANINIFGHINRVDSDSEYSTYDAVLRVCNATVFTGSATITSRTDKCIKVQLLGGNALLNFKNKIENKYIDELELGNWGEIFEGAYYSGRGKGKTYGIFYRHIYLEYLSLISSTSVEEAQKWLIDYCFGLTNEWVAFPIYNETSETMCNDWVRRQRNEAYQLEYRMSLLEGDEQVGNGYPQIKFCIQPYLLPMVKRIFKVLRYKIDISLISDWFKEIFIACANDNIELRKSLPHWTVNDLITQLEYFLGVVFDSEDGVNIVVKPRYNYHSTITNINNIVDEWTVESQEDDLQNIGYSETNKYDRLEDDIRSIAKTSHFNSYEAMVDEFAAEQEDFYELYKGRILYAGDRAYIIKSGGSFKEVDIFTHRIIGDDNDLDRELKICPVQFKSATLDYVVPTDDPNVDKIFISEPYEAMSKPDLKSVSFTEQEGANDEIVNIEDVIEGEEDITREEQSDIMHVALNNGEMENHLFNYIPVPYTHPRPVWLSDKSRTKSLALKSISGLSTLYDNTIALEPIIDRQQKYCFQFVTDTIVRPNSIFIIRNQRYLCEKIEYNITDKGMNKLATGYFYKLI